MQDLAHPIILTKLHRPRVAGDIIIREQLIADLEKSREKLLTLVSAPAGYGKSTLISNWLSLQDTSNAWLSVDVSDSDLRTFLTYVTAAVRDAFPEGCPETLLQLEAEDLAKPDLLGRILANDFDALAQAFILVLDDFQRISGTAVPILLDSLLAHPPNNLHLIIVTRRDPPISFGALRAHGLMNAIRARDLRLTKTEARMFLERASGRILTDRNFMVLHEVTEGWAAGLRLLAGVLRYRDDVDTFARQFSGETRQVREFLTQEIYSSQTPAMCEWLRKTAILERFCAPLSEAVCADHDCDEGKNLDGRDFIQLLIDSALPYSALDDRNMWFRYHHLVHEFLKHELMSTTAPDEVARLHQRAASWLEAQGLFEEALQNYLCAGGAAEAGHMICRQQKTIFDREQWHRLGNLLRQLPSEMVESEPNLLLLATWLLIFRGQDSSARVRLDQLERLLSGESQNEPASKRLLASISAIRSRLSYMEAQAESAAKHAENALAQLPPDCHSERGFALVHLAGACQMRGDEKMARQIIYDELSDMSNPPDTLRSRLLTALCFLDWISADLAAVGRNAIAQAELGIKHNLAESATLGHYFIGIVHYARNELSDAKSSLLSVVGAPIANLEFYIESTLALASVYQVEGEAAKAKETIESLHNRLLRAGNLPGLTETRAFLAELALRAGHVAEAFSWVQQFTPEPPQPYYKFYAPILTFVKTLIAEGSADSQERATSLLTQLERYFGRTHNTHILIAVFALKTLLQEAQGKNRAAIEDMYKAISLGQPGRHIRVFLDIGSGLLRPLQRLKLDNDRQRYVEQILAAFQEAHAQLEIHNIPTATNAVSLPLPEALTKREAEILTLLAKRLSNKEISAQLFISPATVKRHSENIYLKLGVHSRRDAVAKAYALNLLSED